MRFSCPHCNGLSVIRNSRPMSPLTRQLRCVCRNPECGCVFQVGVEVTGIYRQSDMPNPALILPMLKGVGRHWPGATFTGATQKRATIKPFAAMTAHDDDA
ncbi:MAG: ogr/Delta-like zinc finger family protein [Aeromonas sp.]